jgi:signal recognition particle subunit SRP54
LLQNLTDKLTGVFGRLRSRGKLTQGDVDAALREIRLALLDADVALPVVRDFITQVQSQAVGQDIIASVTPAQQMVKIVNDALVAMLQGADDTAHELQLSTNPPSVILMAGLQGSGKTTSSAKLAKRLMEKNRRKVLLVSLDIYRPAAQQQLAILAQQIGAGSLPIVAGEQPLAIAARALKSARIEGYDVIILDSAGRLQIDADLMAELKSVQDLARPNETLLVADALTGQAAVDIARGFHEKIAITGIVLTRVDGDGRGGAALSMRAVTGRPIKFVGLGEKLDGFDIFDPKRIAGKILGQGDVVGLVERAMQDIDEAEAEKMAKKMHSGQFDLTDMLDQLRRMQKMGGIGAMLDMLPGMGAVKNQLAGRVPDEKMLRRQEAMILSMTPVERRNPDLIKASRKKRIATGSGTRVEDINKLLKSYEEMRKVMQQIKKGGLGALMKGGLGQMFGGGNPFGTGQMPNPAEMQKLLGQMGGGKTPNLPPGLTLPKDFKF